MCVAAPHEPVRAEHSSAGNSHSHPPCAQVDDFSVDAYLAWQKRNDKMARYLDHVRGVDRLEEKQEIIRRREARTITATKVVKFGAWAGQTLAEEGCVPPPLLRLRLRLRLRRPLRCTPTGSLSSPLPSQVRVRERGRHVLRAGVPEAHPEAQAVRE